MIGNNQYLAKALIYIDKTTFLQGGNTHCNRTEIEGFVETLFRQNQIMFNSFTFSKILDHTEQAVFSLNLDDIRREQGGHQITITIAKDEFQIAYPAIFL